MNPKLLEPLTAVDGTVRWRGDVLANPRSTPNVRPEEYARLFAAAPEMVRFIAATEWSSLNGEDIMQCVWCRQYEDSDHTDDCLWLEIAKKVGLCE
jgi:hypothetical protein